MTIEELRDEAERQGYRLVEIKTNKGMLEICSCGNKHPKVIFDPGPVNSIFVTDSKGRKKIGHMVQIYCSVCGLSVESEPNSNKQKCEIEAYRKWRTLVSEKSCGLRKTLEDKKVR